MTLSVRVLPYLDRQNHQTEALVSDRFKPEWTLGLGSKIAKKGINRWDLWDRTTDFAKDKCFGKNRGKNSSQLERTRGKSSQLEQTRGKSSQLERT